MFVKIQTWFPFNIQVYINGREWMKHMFDANGISYQCYDNSFTDISDVKVYDKCSVLRIETTINNPREFKVFGTVRHHNGTESRQWKPTGKSISNLYRYAEVSKACNLRLIDSLIDVVPVKSVQQEISSICSGKTVKGRRVSGFNVWSPDVVRIMGAVCDGRYLINSFRNRDIGKNIFPSIQDAKKLSSKTSRTLKRLRQHGLIKKFPRINSCFT